MGVVCRHTYAALSIHLHCVQNCIVTLGRLVVVGPASSFARPELAAAIAGTAAGAVPIMPNPLVDLAVICLLNKVGSADGTARARST